MTVHFAVSELDEEVLQDVDDVIGDVEVYLAPHTPSMLSRIMVGSAGPGWEGRQHRLVLLAKEQDLLAADGADEPSDRSRYRW